MKIKIKTMKKENDYPFSTQGVYNIQPAYAHVKPTVMVKILQNPYGTEFGKEVFVVGSKRPAINYGAGYNVLDEFGRYLYMSVFSHDVEVCGTFENVNIVTV